MSSSQSSVSESGGHPAIAVETLVTSYTYDKLGRTTQTTLPDGSTTHTSYDALGNRATSTDALGRVTSYDYDDMSRLVATHDPDLVRYVARRAVALEHGRVKEG